MKIGVRFSASCVAVVMAVAAQGQIPRTPDGHPDLQGIWSNSTLTPIERPPVLAGKPVLSEAEARAFEKQASGLFRAQLRDAEGAEDRGSELARIQGVKRSALIIDPPDGKIPLLNAAARVPVDSRFDSALDRPLSERCLLGYGAPSGPPMMPVLDNSNYQIVQTPDYVMILVEMVHDARIVRINGTHPPPGVRQWMGDSVGRWVGDTLVVDTRNFTDKTRFRGASQNLHVTERFTRGTGKDAGSFLYKVTIDDPATFSKQWTMEYPFLATAGPIFEYACHEGNYAMTGILGSPERRRGNWKKVIIVT